ncbi:MAG: hypothetical protein DHS20C07_02880 [Methyloligella sp.]|nr:MAG: hypothetical protein DHS20C07_02880 [Methyloligella sp.]
MFKNILIGFILMSVVAFAKWHYFKPVTEQKLIITNTVILKLQILRQEPKYYEVPDTSFNGMSPETLRRLSEIQLNKMIDNIIHGIASKPLKRFVLQEFKITMNQFEPTDTEDRERFLGYLEEIMDIVGIESTDGLFKRWMYGPILGPFT